MEITKERLLALCRAYIKDTKISIRCSTGGSGDPSINYSSGTYKKKVCSYLCGGAYVDNNNKWLRFEKQEPKINTGEWFNLQFYFLKYPAITIRLDSTQETGKDYTIEGRSIFGWKRKVHVSYTQAKEKRELICGGYSFELSEDELTELYDEVREEYFRRLKEREDEEILKRFKNYGV